MTLYRLEGADEAGLYRGLSQKQMLCLLELYLLCFRAAPTATNTHVSTAKFSHSDQTNRLQSEAKAEMVYVNDITGDETKLVYQHEGHRQLACALRHGKSSVGNLFSRSDGVFRRTLKFSRMLLVPEGTVPTTTLDQLKAFMAQLPKTKGKLVF